MTEKLYTIGEFASINKISPRMLRHYDKIGLLKPVSIANNRYRLYGSMQIPTVTLIKKYRSCYFSLEEIAILLENENALQELSTTKLQELRQQEAANADALRKLHTLLSVEKTTCIENLYDISRTVKSKQIICVGNFCTELQIEAEFDRLYASLEKSRTTPTGQSMLIGNLFDDNSYRVAVPVGEQGIPKAYASHTLVEGQYLSTFHYGNYDEIASAYDKLLLYIEQHNLEATGVFLERYFLDISHTEIETEYITEISMKITP